jgi:hypothetical protein
VHCLVRSHCDWAIWNDFEERDFCALENGRHGVPGLAQGFVSLLDFVAEGQDLK